MQYLDSDGPVIMTPAETLELISTAWSERVGIIAVPISRLDPTFFHPGSNFPADVVRQLREFQLRLAVIGDLRQFGEEAGSLPSLAEPSNGEDTVWLVDSDTALEEKIRSGTTPSSPRAGAL